MRPYGTAARNPILNDDDLKMELPYTGSGLNLLYILSSRIYNAYLSPADLLSNVFRKGSTGKLSTDSLFSGFLSGL